MTLEQNSSVDADYYFTRVGEREFAPTIHSEGAWSAADYHFASIAGLMVQELERYREREAEPVLQMSRISWDILGRLPFKNVTIDVEVLRPGKTIELMQAVATIGGRAVIKARAWYLIATQETPQEHEYEYLPAPKDCPPRDMLAQWGGGHMRQIEAREALPYRPGRAAVWMRSDKKLVKDEPSVPLAEFLCRVDIANGVAVRRDPREFAFPNVDLTVHLFRVPEPTWTGVDTHVSWGPNGLGITDSVIHDIHGPVGTAVQTITVRAM